MAQQFDYPKSESELRAVQDALYEASSRAMANGHRPAFKGLLELMSAETTIITAIHNIKANRGSKTAGSDGETMQDDILERSYDEVVARVRTCLLHYQPRPVKRGYIPKPGKDELRPLGIPSIVDRIVQECVRIILEPICDAQFFHHSYGFRPMRSAQMALERVCHIFNRTDDYWVVEGDISKFFDTIDHAVLLRRLWAMGVRDRRVLMVIKQMLKAGIMRETVRSEVGTPQGGIISPLLANVYLHAFDEWVTAHYENKKTRYAFKNQASRISSLKRMLPPVRLVRYADDWVLITNSRGRAELWKWKISRFLEKRLKLTLSSAKTVITDVRCKPISFLGFDTKVYPTYRQSKRQSQYVARSRPDELRVKSKLQEIREYAYKLSRASDKDVVVHMVNTLNSQIRGLIQYYRCAPRVFSVMRKFNYRLQYTCYRALGKNQGVFWCPANHTDNLIAVHKQYTSRIPTIEYSGMKIGITALAFCRFTKVLLKNQAETPYSVSGRTLHMERTLKAPLMARLEALTENTLSFRIAQGQAASLYTFEYYMNCAYAYNRDKGKCRVCGGICIPTQTHIHHVCPFLPKSLLNKVANLATTHTDCHPLIHSDVDVSHLSGVVQKRVQGFREKLRK
jgi:group II intron reverse transcriptase/maturase